MADDPDMALEVTCPTCDQPPRQWCVYVGKSPRAGHETARLHVERTHGFWLQSPVRIEARTRSNAVLVSHRQALQREDQELRAWLRRYVHLLFEEGSP